MLDPSHKTVLLRILDATVTGSLVWQKDPDGYFVAPIGCHNDRILIRRMYLEAASQIGADPYFVEFTMPGWNARFPIVDDSDGWRAIAAILNAAFPNGWQSAAEQAIEFLDLHLPRRD